EPLGAGDDWIKILTVSLYAVLLGLLWTSWRRQSTHLGHYRLLFDWSLPMMLGLLLLPTAWSSYFSLLVLPLAAARSYLLHGAAGRAKAAVARTWIAVVALAGVFTLTSIVLPLVDDTPSWRERVTLLRSAGPLCWATAMLSLALMNLLAMSAPSRLGS